MGGMISTFAVGAIAGLDQYSPNAMNVTAQQPYSGNTLSVKWPFVWGVTATITGAHVVVFLIVAFLADLEIIQDDSNLTMAYLLKRLVEPVKGKGYMEGGDIANEFERSHPDRFLIYVEGALESQAQMRRGNSI